MKGFVKLEAVTHEGKKGISCECVLKDVSIMDRMQMVHALMHSLQFNKAETKAFMMAMQAGILDSSAESVDADAELKDLLKEI